MEIGRCHSPILRLLLLVVIVTEQRHRLGSQMAISLIAFSHHLLCVVQLVHNEPGSHYSMNTDRLAPPASDHHLHVHYIVENYTPCCRELFDFRFLGLLIRLVGLLCCADDVSLPLLAEI